MRSPSLLLATVLLLSSAPAFAESGATLTGSGSDIWAVMQARAEGFAGNWQSFATVFDAWKLKWEKAQGKFITHLARCHDNVRSSNRDTLLPSTLSCYRGQLLLEQDSLNKERAVIAAWPGLKETVRTEALTSIDALIGAIKVVSAGIDASVFTTVSAFKDVRANLLTQYRQPYWLAETHLRADAAGVWLASLLLDLKPLAEDSSLPADVSAKTNDAFTCYRSAYGMLSAAETAPVLAESSQGLAAVHSALPQCAAQLQEAQTLQAKIKSTP